MRLIVSHGLLYRYLLGFLFTFIIKAGVPMLKAQLFPMYYGTLGHLTPLVGIGLIVANKMAGGYYWRTALEILKAAFVAFLVPFVFIYAPGINLGLQYWCGGGSCANSGYFDGFPMHVNNVLEALCDKGQCS